MAASNVLYYDSNDKAGNAGESNHIENNRNETNERDESNHVQNENGRMRVAFTGTNIIDVYNKQESMKCQEKQERFIKSRIKAYMMIKQTGIME